MRLLSQVITRFQTPSRTARHGHPSGSPAYLRLRLIRALSPGERPERGGIGAVDGVLVVGDPAADLAENARGRFRNAAFAVWTDVEQVRAAAADRAHQDELRVGRVLLAGNRRAKAVVRAVDKWAN